MQKISAVIIAKNEADRITATIIAAAKVADEVLVVDTGSDDDTIAVSEQVGAKTIRVDWQGYGPTKNYAYTLAKYDFILSLDADEVLSPELIKSISAASLKSDVIYSVNRLVRLEGEDIHHCGWHPDWEPRLFHRKVAKWNSAAVHETLLFPDNVKSAKLQGVLHHHSFRSLDHFKTKTIEYAHLAAQDWVSKGTKPSIWKKSLGPWWKYIQTYYIYRGYKDGPIGKQVAKTLAMGVREKLNTYKQLL